MISSPPLLPQAERILSLQGTVLEPVRPHASEYNYFRGLNLAAIMLNLLEGRPYLNVGGGRLEAHFSPSYAYAQSFARSQVRPDLQHRRQFDSAGIGRLSAELGIEVSNIAFPAMVVALDSSQEAFLEPGSMEGEVFTGVLTPSDLDPHSQKTLTELFPGL